MKNLLIFSLCLILASCRPSLNEVQVELNNTVNIERKDEMIVIPRSAIMEKLGGFNNEMTIIVSDSGKVIPSQLDDLNGDGNWDELALLIDLKPSQKATLSLKIIKKSERISQKKRS